MSGRIKLDDLKGAARQQAVDQIAEAELAATRSTAKPVVKARAESPFEKNKPGNKYGAKRVTVGSETFDSQAEAGRHPQLLQLQRAGVIKNLERQRSWDLIVAGVKICAYRCDFSYEMATTGALVVEDVKGVKTPAYRLKKKLMKALHDIEIVEISA